jgi:uncharacterized lipoprotein YmbA
VTVLRFDGELGGEMNLSARWSIFGEEGDKALVSRKSVFTEPTGSSNYEALAAAGSRALENLSREIADAIKGLLKGAQGN